MSKKRLALLAAVGLVPASFASAQSIGIDWYGTGGGGGTTQSQMGAGESAGVLPQVNWNSFTGNAQATPQPLNNSLGAATGATVTWTSNNTWNTPAADTAGDLRMMKGYLDSNDTSTTTVTVSGLPGILAAAPYSVIVYYDGDNGGNDRVGKWSVSGATTGNASLWGRDAGGATFAGVYIPAFSPVDPIAGGGAQDNNGTAALTVPAGNFLIFTGLTGGSFTLSAQASVSSDATNRASINGVQIVPGNVPEPGTLSFIGLAAMGLLGRRRRRS